MGKVIQSILIIVFLAVFVSCKKKSTVYVSEKNNLILLENNGNITGYTMNPHYSKCECYILFRGKNTNLFDTARVYRREKKTLMQLENELYGYFIYKIEGNNLLVRYETSIVGCADWLFPKSNETNNIDTIVLKEVGRYFNPKIAFLKEEKVDKYDILHDYFIIHDANLDNAVSSGWEKEFFKMKRLNIELNDCVIVTE